MSEPITIGLVGTGDFATYCVTAYRKFLPSPRIDIIFDFDQVKAKQFSNEFGIKTIASSYDELLNSPCSVVIILTPPNTHFELAKKALLAGKHVLVEKPIAFTLPDAQELLDIANSKQLQMAANFVLRFHPFHRQLREWVATKHFGALKSISTKAALAEYPLNHWYWDKTISGGFFLNTYCHFLDLYDFVAGQTPTKVASSGDQDNGQVIEAYYPNLQARLDVYLHADNENEAVTTTYKFDQATVVTTDWLPTNMTVTTSDNQVETHTTNRPKEDLYQEILASILKELQSRIATNNLKATVSNSSLMQSVMSATAAEANIG